MVKTKLISLFIILSLFIYGCDDGLSGQKQPGIRISSTLILQGNIKEGSIRINKKNVFIKATSGFDIKQIVSLSNSYKMDDVYIGKTSNRVRSVFSAKSDYLSELLQPYEITLSNDFKGIVHVFMTFTSFYDAGSYTKKGNFWRDSIYGPKLAEALKNNKSPITHMGKNNTYPVGAGEPVVIDHTAEPDSVRALMKAAIATKDPRLLVIERTDPAGKVRITAFGKTETIDAGETYEWKFGEAQLNELRKFVVKR